MKSILALLCAAALLVWGGAAPAQDFPSKPIRIVVPFPPGGGVDVGARLLAAKMTERLGWQFVIDNRPGGNGFIAATNIAKSPPDGYSLFMAHVGEIAINPALFANVPYDLDRDFVPITLVGDGPMVYFANSQAPFSTLREFVAAAKAKPDTIAYSSAGNGSLNHLAAEWLAQAAGIKLVHVPFKGGAAAATAVAAGDVPFGVSSIPGLIPHLKSGRVKVLAVTTAKRASFRPDWPTTAELGVGDIDATLVDRSVRSQRNAARDHRKAGPGGPPDSAVTRCALAVRRHRLRSGRCSPAGVHEPDQEGCSALQGDRARCGNQGRVAARTS